MSNTPTVLIVDDDPGIRKMLVEVLTLEGFPVELAENGREALDILATSGPRTVLLDLMMPVLDGRAVVATLNATPGARARHRIILISAIQYLAEAQDLHADAELAKPFTVSQLLDVISAPGAPC